MRRPLREKEKFEAKPDYKYNSQKVSKFINYVMLDGKKSVAESVVYDAFDLVKAETKIDPVEVFDTAIDNISPVMEVRSRRVGGANYQVPYEVRPERKFSLAVRWLLEAARGKKGKPMARRLADELIAAHKKEGDAIKKKQNMHAAAEANKAFAYFAFVGNKNKNKNK